MKAVFVVVAIAALLGVALAVSGRVLKAHDCNAQGSCKVHDFARSQRAAAEKEHTITIWTTQNGMAASCANMLMEVADPDSPKYGQHVSFEKMKELVYDPKALKAIHSYLDAHGIPAGARTVSPNGDFLEVRAPISSIEKMFSAEFHEYTSVQRKAKVTRSLHYTIPSELAEHVSIVAGIANFPMYRRKTSIVHFDEKRTLQQNTSGKGMYPDLIYKTYRMPNATDATAKADLGVFEALGQSYSETDLAAFQKQYNIPRQKIAKIIGPNNPSSCAEDPNNCVEATLDVEYINAMAQGAPMTYWSIADEEGDIFLDFIKAVAKTADAPQVFSISYGGPEHVQNPQDMQQFSTEVCKAGLRGMTIFVASGDDGVAGYEARDDPSKCAFVPEYPAAVPYVTSVGATMGPALVPARDEEVCMSNKGSIITSGGGFSTVFPQPSWQASAVSGYLQTGPNMPPKTKFNTKGRGYPDVSSLGNAYNVVVGGQWFQVSGTSAASPVFCGMVTLVNSYREVAGKSPLGFLNPVLYKIDKSVYNDVVEGTNNCCARGDTAPVCCKYGFTASKGWDSASGWGSIDFPLFAAAVSSLP